MSRWFPDFETAINHSLDNLIVAGQVVDTGHWQGVETEGKPDLVTRELINLSFSVPMQPWDADDVSAGYKGLAKDIRPNLPWADDHFEERVSRVPSNPGEEYKNWPWWKGQFEVTKAKSPSTDRLGYNPPEHQFSHTYQERFWPKFEHIDGAAPGFEFKARRGIRYDFGDLDDVVNLLFEHPYTRQATFPIFFPEDTGAVHGGRVPCTLHYHFMLRNGTLHMWYPIRSCDAVRHFRDDLYMAVRLNHWVLGELIERELRSDKPQVWNTIDPGALHFTAYSFHVHKGDLHLL